MFLRYVRETNDKNINIANIIFFNNNDKWTHKNDTVCSNFNKREKPHKHSLLSLSHTHCGVSLSPANVHRPLLQSSLLQPPYLSFTDLSHTLSLVVFSRSPELSPAISLSQCVLAIDLLFDDEFVIFSRQWS